MSYCVLWLTEDRHLNHGSPVNVVAGQGAANLEDLVEYYEERRKLEEEAMAEKSAK